jgi:acetyl-CoA synthetase
MSSIDAFLEARDLLFELRTDHDAAVARFRWPELDEFNWALDHFDRVAELQPDRTALWVVSDGEPDDVTSYGELARRSNQVANFLRDNGVGRGDRILLMVGNITPLWEVMLAAMKLGAVIIPASTLLGEADLADRLERGHVAHVVAEPALAARFAGLPGDYGRIVVGEFEGWTPLAGADGADTDFEPDGPTRAADPLLLYFTSGTTSLPKLVEHTHASYPVGHLSTMFWIGLQPGDVHLNMSSPGWAKHAWSNLYAPWNAEATVLVFNYPRFDAAALLDTLVR